MTHGLSRLRHELRTPLNQIIGYSELLIEDAEAAGQGDLAADLGRIRRAARNLLETAEEALSANPGDGREPTRRPMPREPRAVPETPAAIAGTILVVDDDQANRDVLSRRLERQGHRVRAAEGGHEALAMLRAEPFDLVLLDILMPVMDGYRVLELIKGDPGLRDLPVIVVSALGDLESVVRCIEGGADDYLTKPFDPVLLRARVGACLEKKRLRDQEVEYLRQVTRVTAAAAAVEARAFEPESLAEVATRADALGQLARVFQRMAREVHTREARLRQEVQALRIEIDESKKARQVAEITDTAYFEGLRRRAHELRRRGGG